MLALGLFASLAHAYPAHYFVVRETAQGIQVVSHRVVQLSGTPESASLATAPNRLERTISATVRDKRSGAVVFATRAITSPWLRGEFHGHGKIDGKVLANDAKVYAVRVPVRAGAVLRLQPDEAAAPAALDVDLDAYAGSAASKSFAPAGQRDGTMSATGDAANRLDLLVIAEGYVEGQQTQFVADVQALMDAFFSISPYADFRHLTNVRWLFVPSNQQGADKPDCPETPGAPVSLVDTAFDATFCTAGLRRLVTVNVEKVLAAAAAVPDWDKILVLVNDTEYGGSGGSLSVGTRNAMSAGIMQHEFGHSFTLLADEYDTPYPGFPACSDVASGMPPCEANVTDQADRNLLKWKGWVAGNTPTPTVDPLADPMAAGLWLGARYQSSGIYRQCFNGLMRNLGMPFCDVDGEAFVKRLYAGGWGSPAAGVSLIEPNVTPGAASVQSPRGSTVTFQANVIGSPGAQALTATWRVDGAQVQSSATSSGALQTFSYVVPDNGTHTIELQVTDNTTFLLQAPTRSRQWTVTGTASGVPGAPTLTSAVGGDARATLTFTAPTSDGGSPITSYAATCNPGAMAASGSASPLTVTGLTNGVTYSCSVRAANASGPGPASASLSVTPTAASASAQLLGVRSRRTFGPAGTFDMTVDTSQPIGGAVTVVPHEMGDGFRIVFQFNAPVTAPGTATAVDPAGAPLGSAAAVASGNEVVVTLTAMPDNRRARISLAGVNGTAATYAVSIGFLVGDVDGTRSVNSYDVASVKQRAGETTNAGNALFDIDGSGSISSADILSAKGRSGLVLP